MLVTVDLDVDVDANSLDLTKYRVYFSIKIFLHS